MQTHLTQIESSPTNSVTHFGKWNILQILRFKLLNHLLRNESDDVKRKTLGEFIEGLISLLPCRSSIRVFRKAIVLWTNGVVFAIRTLLCECRSVWQGTLQFYVIAALESFHAIQCCQVILRAKINRDIEDKQRTDFQRKIMKRFVLFERLD